MKTPGQTLSRSNVLTSVLFILPVIFFFYNVYAYSVNVPVADDFESIFDFLNGYYGSSGLGDKAGLIFSQHNEHRIVFNRLVTLLAYAVFGAIDLRLLILFGNLAIVGIIAVLFLSYRRDRANPLYFFPAFLLLFQFQYYEGIGWAMASVSNFYVVFFAFLSLLLLAFFNAAPFFLAAISFAAMAAFTQGGGLLAWIAGLAVLSVKKQYRKAAVWAVFAAVVYGVYFYGYHRPPYHPDGVKVFLNAPLLPIRYFFSMLGSPFPAPEAFGVLSAVVFGALTLKGYYKKNIAAYSFMLFLFMTAAAAAVSRSGLGLEQSLESRYRIIPAMLYILYYTALLELIGKEAGKKAFFAAVLVLSFAFNAHAYMDNIEVLKMRKKESSYRMFKWRAAGAGLLHPDEAKASAILSRSIKNGFYRPVDTTVIEAGLTDISPGAPGTVAFEIENVFYDSTHVGIDGWAFIEGQGSKGSSVYIEASGAGGAYLFDTVLRKRPDLNERSSGADVSDSGFFCVIPRRYLENGLYAIGIYVKNDKTSGYGLTGETVRN